MDVKDACFLVVDPDDGVRHDLILSAKPIAELRDGRCQIVGVFDDAATSRRCACVRQYGVQGTASSRCSSIGPPSTMHLPNVPSSTRPSASRTCCSTSELCSASVNSSDATSSATLASPTSCAESMNSPRAGSASWPI